ncbi:phage tail tube protein [Tsukamurella paurometabola]|uniref:Major tail protein n=1 Tax=Tsukamurella paurometabola TaxID=2061 RepID=A0ABS5NG64_TSUPA|nr:hypothetical protein [Tsukamurella paurometabola]MBS4103269.1 hypothetical protein [Tsukamurella paurometabola]
MATVKSLKDKNDDLVVVAGDMAMIATKYKKGAIPTSITDASGVLIPLPVDWESAGELEQKAGAKVSPNTKTTDILGYGSLPARRVVKTSEAVELAVTAQEARKINQAMFWGTDPDADFDVDPVSGEVKMLKSASAKMTYWSVILIGHDDGTYGDVYPFWIFPKMTVTKADSVTLSMEDAVSYPLTLTAFEDADFGGYVATGWAGPGAKALNAAAGFTSGS